jgi:hypothetical protein
MPNSIPLHGGAAAVDLGAGYSLRTPGLKGSVRVHGPKAAGTRGPELATDAFDQAFAAAGIDEIKTIELEVGGAPFPAAAAPLRGPEGGDAFELAVPDLGADFGQVVLSVDEAGALHWHFPVDDHLAVQPATVRGAGGTKLFRIPREIATPPAAPGAERGLVSLIGRKLLKVLVYPVTDAILGPLTDMAVGKWEAARRPHALRRYLPGDHGLLGAGDWARLAAGPALLLVHGTFSTAESAFGGLPAATLDALAAHYGNRVFAFDHPSLSVTPRDNADRLFADLPQSAGLEVDIVCHSRGGLVSRCIAAAASDAAKAARLRVRRLVLVGVPNQGTPLADAEHMVEFIDRMTTAMNLFPETGAGVVLEGILTVVKVVGHAGLVSLAGLRAMRPGSPFLVQLDAEPVPGVTLLGIGGDFEPRGAGLGAAFCKAADSLLDRVFEQEPNDLVVPTAGMRAWGGANRIPDAGFLAFPAERGVMHTSYFPQAETSQRLLQWLA